MPPKGEIFAKLLFLINATATRLVSTVNELAATWRLFLDQAAKENKFQQ